MAEEKLVVPVRFRVTTQEEERYKAAMAKLGLLKMSTFLRWALNNSCTQVLDVSVKPQPAKKPKRELYVPAPVEQPAIEEQGATRCDACGFQPCACSFL